MKKILLLIFTIVTCNILAQTTFERTYIDTGNCRGINVIQTFDGGFLITATENSATPNRYNLFIIKVNPIGDTSWTKLVSLDLGFVSRGIQTSDSGYVFTGSSNSKVLLYKINNMGDSLWLRTFNFGTNGYSLIESSNHELIIVGEYFIGTTVCCNPVAFRTDSLGILLGQIFLPNGYGRAYGIVETPDSNFVISNSGINSTPPVPYLTKTTKTGSVMWNKQYSGYCECNVNWTRDNGFIITGTQTTNKPYIIKTDSAGNIEWNKNGIYNTPIISREVAQAFDNGYLLTGEITNSSKDLCLFKINSAGDSLWTRTFGGVGVDIGNSVINTNDNGFAIVGYSTSFGTGEEEVYFIKTDSSGLLTSIKTFPLKEKQITFYPNPSSKDLFISSNFLIKDGLVTIFDITGNNVFSVPFNGKEMKIDIKLSSGIYLIQVTDNYEIWSEKIIKE